jgi:hypothetical protein
VRGADYSLPLYSLLDDVPESAPMPHRFSLQRETSNESSSTALSFFSCVQEVDPETAFYSADISGNKMSHPLIIDDQLKEKSSTPRKISDSSQTDCCCRLKGRLLFCC